MLLTRAKTCFVDSRLMRLAVLDPFPLCRGNVIGHRQRRERVLFQICSKLRIRV